MRSSRRAFVSSPRSAVPLALAAALVGFIVLSAVGRSPRASDRATTAARTPTVEVRRSKLGRILVDAHGRTLYLFREDGRNRSTCFGGCARVWPPLLVSGSPKAGSGVRAAKLTAGRRRHSRLRQVIYDGHPLYTTVADERPGQFEGQGFLGTWFAVSPAGHQIGRASKNAGGY